MQKLRSSWATQGQWARTVKWMRGPGKRSSTPAHIPSYAWVRKERQIGFDLATVQVRACFGLLTSVQAWKTTPDNNHKLLLMRPSRLLNSNASVIISKERSSRKHKIHNRGIPSARLCMVCRKTRFLLDCRTVLWNWKFKQEHSVHINLINTEFFKLPETKSNWTSMVGIEGARYLIVFTSTWGLIWKLIWLF